ncbi:MAG: PEGA domain-containing protein [Deltaproteobacteria bacterium]|nr:PEGA domain-containing protein [Deltaproteobacteria bacterium]
MNSPVTSLLRLLLVCVILGRAPIAAADEADPITRATELANTGITALQAGRWEAAVEALKAALPIAIDSGEVALVAAVQRALGKAHDFGGEGPMALVYYNAYLTHGLDEPLKRKEVEERVAAITAATRSRLVIEANAPGARVAVDGQPAVSVDTELALDPGRHWIQVMAAGYETLEDDLYLVAGEVLRYDAKLQVAAPAPASVVVVEPEDDGGGHEWAWVGWVAGLGASVGGAYLVTEGSDAGPIVLSVGAVTFLISSIALIAD